MYFVLAGLLVLAGCSVKAVENNNRENEAMQEEAIKMPEATSTTAPTETPGPTVTPTELPTPAQKSAEEYAALFEGIKKAESDKGVLYNNPLMTQRFGADPYAMVYEDTLYIYMTGDVLEYGADGTLGNNTYSKINTINVISTKDMVNWTDHGSVYAAGRDGAATWANNSWAPAAAWKIIDGKPQFFLYFANSGGGIGVLTADSPTGRFKDPIGGALISRNTPTCDSVLWLFDPAVLIDDDGSAYIYFGGGVPEGKEDHPGTARVAKLGEDMISLDGDPVAIDAPFLFEDSGIHKIGDTYYYSYSSNFSVTAEGTAEYGMTSGEICYMTSDNPMGPFTYQGVVFPNPGKFFGVWGNNHHCIFNFHDQWYITYHAQMLEQKLGLSGGYRSTHIDVLEVAEDGSLEKVRGTKEGAEQITYLDPYQLTEAETMAAMAGVSTTQFGARSVWFGSGNMAVCGIETGDWLCVKGVDFGEEGAVEFVASVCAEEGAEGVIELRTDLLYGEVIGYLPVTSGNGKDCAEMTCELLKKVTGVHDVYFTFYGSGYTWDSWQFK